MPHNDPQSYLASGQARTVAYALDLVACALLLMPAGIGFYLAGTPQAGGFEFALILFAFHTFFLSFREGASPGKYAHNIAVLSATGRPLPVWQCLLRAGCIALPWLLMSVPDSLPLMLDPMPVPGGAGLPMCGVAWLTLDALLIHSARDRRSLTDRLSGSLVVALPPPQPHRAPAVPMFSASDAEFGHPPKKPPAR